MRTALLITALLTGCAASTPDSASNLQTRVSANAVPGSLVVDLIDGTTLEDAQFATGLPLQWASPLSADEALAVVEVDDLAAAMARLEGDPLIEAAEPSQTYEALGFPNDPMYLRQWNFARIGAESGWRAGGGDGIVVAVIDTGVTQVGDLAGTEVLTGASLVPAEPDATDGNGHGTHVAGTIAQTTNNGLGVAGLAPNATVLPIKALSAGGFGKTEWIASAIDEAVDQGADVINLSLGGPGSAVLEVAVDKALAAGVIIVAAAGNGGREGVSYPAAYPGVIAVSATGPDDALAPYSSWGAEVVVSAPGGDKRAEGGGILQNTVRPGQADDTFVELQGTSMASPHVAGALAVLLGAGAASPQDARSLLEASAVDLGDPGRDARFGHGRIDIRAATRALALHRGGALFALGALVATWLAGVGQTRQRLFLGLLGGAVAGGLFFLPLLPFPPNAAVALLSRPLLHWPAVLADPSWARSPMWLSVAVPGLLAFILGPTRSLGPITGAVVAGVGVHLLHGAATGSLSPTWLPGLFGAGWLGLNGLLCLVAALAIALAQRIQSREA